MRWLGTAAVLLLAAALHGSLFWLSHVPGPRTLMGDELDYWPAAQRLAGGLEPERTSPLWPPMYPRFLAVVVSLFGAEMLAVEIVQTLMLLAVALLLRQLTRAWTGSARAASAAFAVALLYPPWAAFAHYLWPETFHLFLFFGALWILARRGESSGWRIAAGLLLGLAVETKSLLIPFLPILFLPGLNGSVRQAFRRTAPVCLGLALVVVPSRFGAAGSKSPSAVIESAALFNVWVGLQETSRKELVDSIVKEEYDTYLGSASTDRERNELLRRKILGKVQSEGVAGVLRSQLGRQYFRLFDKESFLIVMLRGKALHPAAPGYRAPPRLLAGLLVATSYGLYAAVLVGAVLGLAVCGTRGPWLRVASAFLVYNLALFLVLHVKSRYRIQFLPFLFLYFGCAVAWLSAQPGRTSGEGGLGSRRLSPRAWIAGGAAALALLFAAFGGPLLGGSEPQYLGDRPFREPTGPLRADPNPIRVCDGSGLGVTTLSWRAAGRTGPFEVRVSSPDGSLFARTGGPGTSRTRKWVRDGMVFYLIDAESGEVLDKTTVRLTRSGCEPR